MERENIFLVGLVLVVGSIIGGMLNYFIGFGGNKLFNRFKKSEHSNQGKHKKKGNKLLDKFGWGAIFFASWLPVIGDFILISAGVKKMKFTKFTAIMISGKIFKTVIVVVGLGSVF